MNENHFSYFKVENFKRFESFEMDDIGQFNLIVGDNNVGKTSVLEALCFDFRLNKYVNYLNYILQNFKRFNIQNSPLHEFLNKKIQQPAEPRIRYTLRLSNNLSFSYEYVYLHGYLYLNDNANPKEKVKEKEKIYIENLGKGQDNEYHNKPPLIPLFLGYSESLSGLYSAYIQKKVPIRQKLISSLNAIIPGLIDFDIDTFNNNAILLRIQNNDVLLPLATYGDGAIKLFRILLEIVMNSNKRIMIDEIDAGIHHKRFLPFWETIIQTAKENNVQIFATTHNIECIKFFRNTFLEEGMQELQEKARVFRLVEHKNKQVSAYSHNFEAFDHAIENENELR